MSNFTVIFLLISPVPFVWYHVFGPPRPEKKDILAPHFVLGSSFFILFGLKALYVLSDGYLNISPRESVSLAIGVYDNAFFGTSVLLVLFSISVVAGFLIAGHWPRKGYLFSRITSRRIKPGMARIALFFGAAISLATAFSLISIEGSIGNYFRDGMSLRQKVFEGKGYLMPFMSLFRIAFFVYVVGQITMGKAVVTVRNALIFSLAVVFDGLVASRSLLLFSVIGPTITVYHYCVKRLSPAPILIIGPLVLVFFLVGHRVLTRDQYFESNARVPPIELVLQSLKELPKFFFGGADTGHFDSLVHIVDNSSLWGEYRGGGLSASLFYPIPRRLYPGKPVGQMGRYTEEFFPSYYWPNRVELSTSYPGAWYLEFGILGLGFGGLFLGWFVRALYLGLRATRHHPVLVYMYGVVLFRAVAAYRGDIHNSIVAFVNEFVPFILIWLCTTHQQRKYRK